MKKFVLIFTVLLMSAMCFSQVTISQEDYDKLPTEAKSQIEKMTTEKAVKGEMSKYANLGKEIGVAVNETLKAVEDSAVRISESELGKTATSVIVWKLLYKEITGIIVGLILLAVGIYMILSSKSKLSIDDDDTGGWVGVVLGAVFFICAMLCIF